MWIAGAKERTRDDLGECITEKGYETGIVERLHSEGFKSPEGFETNYYALIRLDVQSTCLANLSKYDYKLLKEGDVLNAEDASPFSYKVYGAWTNRELLNIYVFGLMVTMIVGLLFAVFHVLDHLFRFSTKLGNLSRWALGDANKGLSPKSKIPFTLLGVISAFVFAFSGIHDLGAPNAFWQASVVTLGYLFLASMYVLFEGGSSYFKYNARLIGFATTGIVLISGVFHFIFGLKLSYMFRVVMGQL